MAINKIVPSGGTDGVPIVIDQTATAGNTFHTAHATALDEIYMYLSNVDTVDHNVTVEFGGATSPDNLLKFKVPAGETILAIAGIPLTNSKVCAAFADSADKVTMAGYVNRIS